MNSFEFELGRVALKRKNETGQEQVEPPCTGSKLDEWRRGYGGEGKPCQKKPSVDSAEASAASASSQLPGGRDSRTGSVRDAAAATVRKQAALFDPGEPEKPKTAKSAEPKPKPPTPVPLDEVQEEINLLVSIGIGLIEAEDLVRKQQWTLDQMVCQWKLGNEAGLPQSVIGRVARYGQLRWNRSAASKS